MLEKKLLYGGDHRYYFLDLLIFLFKYKTFILSIVLMAIVVTWIYILIFNSPFLPIYQSRCTISSTDHSVENPFIKELRAGFNDVSFSRSAEVTTILTSRAVAYFVVQRHDLLPKLFHDVWNDRNHKWLTHKPPTLQNAYDLLQKIIKIKADEKNHTLVFTCYHQNPELPQQILTCYLDGLNIFLRERTAEIIDLQLANLRLQLAYEKDLNIKEKLASLIVYQIEKRKLTKAPGYFGFKVISKPTTPQKESVIRENILKYLLFPLTFGAMAFLAAVLIAMFLEYCRHFYKLEPPGINCFKKYWCIKRR